MNYENILVTLEDSIAHIRLNRPAKRNAVNNGLLEDLEACFDSLGADATVVVISGEGAHFSAGLDLSEHQIRSPFEVLQHSQWWHRVFQKIQFGGRPVVSALHGAVVGGGLELAAACHVRVAEKSAYYALPEGVRGIYVGGGGSVRIPRLIGVARMMDMMLTGRTYSATEGVPLGFSQYLVGDGEGFDKGLDLATAMCRNAPLTNFAVIQALPRIADSDPRVGYLMESLVSAVAQGDKEAKGRVRAFLEKRAAKVARPD